jgi:hypothetical protein
MTASPLTIAALALAYGFLFQLLFFGHSLGINWPLAIAALLGIAWFVRPRGSRIDPLDHWITPAAVALSACAAIRSDPSLLTFDVPASLALTGMSIAAMAGASVTRRSMIALCALAARLAVAVGARPVAVIERIMEAPPRPSTSPRSREAVAALRGLTFAMPFLVVFALLFASADAVFARSLDNVLDWLHLDVRELVGRGLFAGAGAWLAAGAFASVTARAVAQADTPTLRWPWPFGASEAIAMLAAIDALFVAFVALQFAYLFGGLDTMDAAGLTYADYARRGFFELIAASFLVGGIVLALEATVSRRPVPYVGAAVALVAATLVVLASAALRLQLYQSAYGWSEQRFYAAVAIAWLAITAVAAVVTLLRNQGRWLLHAGAIAGVAVALVVNLVGPRAFVASQIAARALQPSTETRPPADIFYLASLGDEAVPAMLDVLPRLPELERFSLGTLLRARLTWMEREPASWQEWNLARERAREALERSREALLRYPDTLRPRAEAGGP